LDISSKTENEAPTSGAPAVDRAFRILDYLANQETGCALTQISRALDLNKSTCFKILQALTSAGATVKSSSSGRYWLGPKLVELGVASRPKLGVREEIAAILRPLVDELNLTCVVGQVLPHHNGAVILDRVVPTTEEVLRVGIGHVYPVTLPALGKAVFAHVDPVELERLSFRSKAEAARFREGVEEARRVGYGVSREEHNPGVNAVTTAVLGSDGRPAFILSLSGTSTDLPSDQLDAAGERLRDLAAIIADRLEAQYLFPDRDL
jgi:DNA-binding IclR family transcriptional regulator